MDDFYLLNFFVLAILGFVLAFNTVIVLPIVLIINYKKRNNKTKHDR